MGARNPVGLSFRCVARTATHRVAERHSVLPSGGTRSTLKHLAKLGLFIFHL